MIKIIKSLEQIPEWIINMIPFEKQIKYIRERLGLSQRTLAKNIGTSQSGIGNIENGKGAPTLQTIEKIAKELNCTLRILLIPNKDIDSLLSDKVNQKVDELLREAITNSGLEEQRPSEDVIKFMKKELRDDLLKNKKRLWDE